MKSLKSCKITILNPVSRVYKEYIIWCAVTAPKSQNLAFLFLKVPPFLKMSPVQRCKIQTFKFKTNNLCNLPLFHLQSSALSLFLTILQNLNLHLLVLLEANHQSGWKRIVSANCNLQLWSFFRCQVMWLCCAAIFVYIHIFVSYGSDGCRLIIENYKLFLDGFMHGKGIKSSSLVWVNE